MLNVAPTSARRRVKIIHFSPWADRLVPTDAYLEKLAGVDVRARLAQPDDKELLQMARLDCDWHGENSRVFASLRHPGLDFLPGHVLGGAGLIDLAKSTRPPDEEWWLIFDGQNPQKLAGLIEKIMPLLKRVGVKLAWYAFDEVSRTTSAFKEIAPHLSVLIHDEFPLDATAKAQLSRTCVTVHHSWVANLLPFAAPFNETPEEKILFLGSKLGLTEHRRRQIEFLRAAFGDRVVAIHDHSVSVADRMALNRYKVSLCPEGRKFTTPAMGMTHTDRPFWSGCLGMVPVSEDSRNGGRLEDLADKRLVYRYPHGDLEALKIACEKALAASVEDRRRIYEYFNRNETVGSVMAAALHAAN